MKQDTLHPDCGRLSAVWQFAPTTLAVVACFAGLAAAAYLALHVIADGQARYTARNAKLNNRLAPGKWWHDPAQLRLPRWVARWAG